MNYSSIRSMDISNGEYTGVSLFVQGCHFHCYNCFNQDTWDFNNGKEWNERVEKEFLELINRDYIKRVSLLGGEPLADENVIDINLIINKIKVRYPSKKIWLFTGYTLENIIKLSKSSDRYEDKIRLSCVKKSDILIDGQFVDSLKDMNLKWKGSSNQRVIDVKKTFDFGAITLYE